MTNPGEHAISLVQNVRTYLELAGWKEQPPGPAGALWEPPPRLGHIPLLAVPRRLSPNTTEWRGIIERLSAHENRAQSDITLLILTQFVDVTRFVADNKYVINETIPFEAGSFLVRSAYKMFRSVGTTARRPRAQIGGNFSDVGDAIVKSARMAHTERGSYVVPIWMPLTPAEPDAEDTPSLAGMEIQRIKPEPAERRVTRTLAQSLAAVREVIIRPEREPKAAAALLPLVTAGGSHEFVGALHQIVSQPDVARFEATFSWAGGLAAPGGVEEEIVIDAEAAPLLENAARLLRVAVKFPRQIYTGQIVMISRRPGENFGEIAINTVRQNRACELHVRLVRETLDLAYDWARSERAVIVEGEVTKGGPGRPLRIESPRQIHPLDETFLPEPAGNTQDQPNS